MTFPSITLRSLSRRKSVRLSSSPSAEEHKEQQRPLITSSVSTSQIDDTSSTSATERPLPEFMDVVASMNEVEEKRVGWSGEEEEEEVDDSSVDQARARAPATISPALENVDNITNALDSPQVVLHRPRKRRQAHLLSLPNELLFLIGESCLHYSSFQGVHRFSLCSRFLHSLLNPHLYRLLVNFPIIYTTLIPRFIHTNNLHALTLLLDKGGDANATEWGDGQWTPLQHAVDQTTINKEMVKLLCEKGADVNCAGDTGETVMHWLAWDSKAVGIVEILLKHGADMRKRDKYGRTPLHVAAMWGQGEMCEFLVGMGAERELRDRKRKRPVELAEEGGHEKCVDVLRAEGTRDRKGKGTVEGREGSAVLRMERERS